MLRRWLERVDQRYAHALIQSGNVGSRSSRLWAASLLMAFVVLVTLSIVLHTYSLLGGVGGFLGALIGNLYRAVKRNRRHRTMT